MLSGISNENTRTDINTRTIQSMCEIWTSFILHIYLKNKNKRTSGKIRVHIAERFQEIASLVSVLNTRRMQAYMHTGKKLIT